MVADDALLVDPDNDDPATTPRGTAPRQAHDGARRLRRCSAVPAREEAASLLLVATLGSERQRATYLLISHHLVALLTLRGRYRGRAARWTL